jgi:hypothetical protein
MAFFFGLSMLAAPEKMLENVTSANTADMQHVLQWAGTMLLSIGIITFLSRNDPGSKALKAVMLGSIIMHIVGFAVDLYQNTIGFVKSSGLIMGAIVHGLLIIGFVYYLIKLQKQ